jgi:hypothetical protein
MSKRGAEFFGKWMTDNVMGGKVGGDIISVADLTAKLFSDARVASISEHEIEDSSRYDTPFVHCIGADWYSGMPVQRTCPKAPDAGSVPGPFHAKG